MGHEVRYSGPTSGYFNIVTALSCPAGRPLWIQSYPGNEAPASGSWDIVYGGSVIASSTNPNGWQYHVNWDGLDQAQLESPITAVVGTGYKLRRTYSGGGTSVNYSFPFTVAASDLVVNAGVKYLEKPNGAKVAGGSSGDPFGFGGQWGYYTDSETGRILCGHRFYDATQGRWLNGDPMDYDGGIDLYGYAFNNAVYYVDADGYMPYPVDFKPPPVGPKQPPKHPAPKPCPNPFDKENCAVELTACQNHANEIATICIAAITLAVALCALDPEPASKAICIAALKWKLPIVIAICASNFERDSKECSDEYNKCRARGGTP